jgi:hypothetical protein
VKTIVRILGVAVLTALLVVGLAHALFPPNRDSTLVALVLACVGGIVGAVAGAAREVVEAQGR